MDNGTTRRRDPRYVEESANLSDWIQVKMARQFGEQIIINGLLWDLTPRAVKVAFPAVPNEPAPPEPPLPVGSQVLLTFRFRNLMTVSATATVARVDNMDLGVGIVLFFDFIHEEDRESVMKICTAYSRDRDVSLGGPDEL